MKKRRRLRNRAGFTVAEMVVATVIIAVGFLALAGLMATVMGRHTRATVVQEMTTIAESKLEELRAASIIDAVNTAIVDVGGSVATDVADHNDVITSSTGRGYKLRWEIADHASGAKSVTMRISMTQTHDRHKVQPMDFSTLLLVVR